MRERFVSNVRTGNVYSEFACCPQPDMELMEIEITETDGSYYLYIYPNKQTLECFRSKDSRFNELLNHSNCVQLERIDIDEYQFIIGEVLEQYKDSGKTL